MLMHRSATTLEKAMQFATAMDEHGLDVVAFGPDGKEGWYVVGQILPPGAPFTHERKAFMDVIDREASSLG